MEFMKKQEGEILKLETGELVIKQYPDSLGEIIFYNGSLRIAINPTTWPLMRKNILSIIDNEVKLITERSESK